MKRILLAATVILFSLAINAAPNKKEVTQLKAFLQSQSAHGKPNYMLLSVPLDNPAAWRGVTWNGDGRVTAIDWHDHKLSGQLNLAGFVALQTLNVAHNEITMLDVSGCTSLQSVDVSHNHLAELDLDNCPMLVALNCYRNRLTELSITSTPRLKMLNCTGNLFVSFSASGAPMLETLYVQNCHLEHLDVDSCASLKSI